MKKFNPTLLGLILLCLALTLTFTACNDDDENISPPNPPAAVPNFFPMSIGNYWIYDVVRVDSNGTETLLNYSDTIRIIGDTSYNSNIYYSIEQDRFLTTQALKDTIYRRDSSGYLVNLEGRISFSADDYHTIFHTWEIPQANIKVDYFVDDSLYTYNVPAGNFDCLNYVGLVQYLDPASTFPDRYMNTAYSNNIGIIFQNEIFASSLATEYQRRLREYHFE